MNTANLDLRERARQLHAQVAGWEDDRKRSERRRAELQAEIDELGKRRLVTEESIARLDDKIAAARDEITQINRLVPQNVVTPPKPTAAVARAVNPDAVRAGVLRFRQGTVAELAAYLRLTPAQVQQALEAEVKAGVICFPGQSFGRSPVWEYVPPEDPGQAFLNQQQQRTERAEAPVYSDAIENVGGAYLQALPKDVRKVAREAIKAGWDLTPGGSGHYQLSRDDRMISISSTPANASAEARALRRRLNGAGMRTTRRGRDARRT